MSGSDVVRESDKSQTLGRVAGLWQVFILCASAPGFAAGVAFNFVFVAVFAAGGMPFIFVVAGVVILTVACTFSEFAKRLPAAGSAFTYCSVSLGRVPGFLVGWLFAGVYMATVVGASVLMGGWMEAFATEQLHIDIPWWIFTVILAATALYASTLGLKQAMSLTMILLAIEVIPLLALGVTMLVDGGPSGVSLDPLTPSGLGGVGFSTAALGFVYAILSFAGFEEGATLAEETRGRQPTPRGLILGALIVALLFIFMAFAVSIGVGTGEAEIAAFVEDPASLQTLTAEYWSSGAEWIIVLAVAASTWAFYIAALNASARVLFSMAREGVLPSWLAHIREGETAPVKALTAATVAGLVVAIPVGALVKGGPLVSWGYIGFLLGMGFLLIYAAVSLGLIVFMLRRHRNEFKVFQHLIVPAVSLVVPIYVLERLFDPGPGAPYTYFPFGIAAFLLVGVAILLRIRHSRPDSWHALGHVLAGEEVDDDFVATSAAVPEKSA